MARINIGTNIRNIVRYRTDKKFKDLTFSDVLEIAKQELKTTNVLIYGWAKSSKRKRTKYVVNIDLNTIKRNENAGEHSEYIPGRKTIRFLSKKQLPDYFIHGVNCMIDSWEISSKDEKCRNVSGMIIDEELIKKCYENKEEITFVFENKMIEVKHHLPIPEYSYEYEEFKIYCDHCKKEHEIDKLINECYQAKLPNWTVLEYETIDHALIRLKESGENFFYSQRS